MKQNNGSKETKLHAVIVNYNYGKQAVWHYSNEWKANKECLKARKREDITSAYVEVGEVKTNGTHIINTC